MSKTIIVDVEGESAFERAKERIARQTEDVDSEQVTAVYAEITIAETTNAPEPEPAPDPGDDDTKTSLYSEEDRSLGECSRGSQHEALTAVARLEDEGHDEISSKLVGRHVVDSAPGTMSVALGKLYRKRLLDREKWTGTSGGAGTMAFHYSTTEHGRSELRRMGEYEPESTPDDYDGVFDG